MSPAVTLPAHVEHALRRERHHLGRAARVVEAERHVELVHARLQRELHDPARLGSGPCSGCMEAA